MHTEAFANWKKKLLILVFGEFNFVASEASLIEDVFRGKKGCPMFFGSHILALKQKK